MIRQRYDIYLNTLSTGILHAAECVLEEVNSRLNRVGFRYTSHYLNHPSAFALDPFQLPLQTGDLTLTCQGGVPGLIDDYLPDDWGRKVLAQLAFYRNKQVINNHSIISTLALTGGSRVGALSIVPQGQQPIYQLGLPISNLTLAESAAQQIDSKDFNRLSLDEINLLYLANSGSGVGGARPKALVQVSKSPIKAYLAKFNRLHSDDYNNAKVELACLNMAKSAGIDIASGYIEKVVNGREILLLERFDINGDGSRKHVLSINSLLKEKNTQRDAGTVFRYDDICSLLQKYSISIEKDLQQLLRLMLFNSAINNLDDHERNFSLINAGHGYQLSPAYDLVPTLVTGQYHVAGYGYSPNPPNLTESKSIGKIFGLAKPVVNQIAEDVIFAVSNWSQFAENAKVDEEEQERISSFFNLV